MLGGVSARKPWGDRDVARRVDGTDDVSVLQGRLGLGSGSYFEWCGLPVCEVGDDASKATIEGATVAT